MSGLFDSLTISGSGLSAERMRMDVTAENLANAQTPGYRRKDVVLQESFDRQLGRAMGVEVSQIAQDQGAQKRVYDPTNPSADAQGYVTMPNVETVTEMVDLITASRSYEANVTAMQTAKSMWSKTLELLR